MAGMVILVCPEILRCPLGQTRVVPKVFRCLPDHTGLLTAAKIKVKLHLSVENTHPKESILLTLIFGYCERLPWFFQETGLVVLNTTQSDIERRKITAIGGPAWVRHH